MRTGEMPCSVGVLGKHEYKTVKSWSTGDWVYVVKQCQECQLASKESLLLGEIPQSLEFGNLEDLLQSVE